MQESCAFPGYMLYHQHFRTSVFVHETIFFEDIDGNFEPNLEVAALETIVFMLPMQLIMLHRFSR
eukprot:6635478-Karenia_brevis.AAC.1